MQRSSERQQKIERLAAAIKCEGLDPGKDYRAITKLSKQVLQGMNPWTLAEYRKAARDLVFDWDHRKDQQLFRKEQSFDSWGMCQGLNAWVEKSYCLNCCPNPCKNGSSKLK